jgi:hypothetical protein
VAGCTTTGVKLKNQDLTLASKVGLLQGSGRTPRRLRTAGPSQELTWDCELAHSGPDPRSGGAPTGVAKIPPAEGSVWCFVFIRRLVERDGRADKTVYTRI